MKISVIIASYNYAGYIEEAINSVINQSYQDWELIIVDDGSSDNSVKIIKSYCEKDSRIKLFQHEDCEQMLEGKTALLPGTPFNASNQIGKNKGLKETLLLGIKHVSGEWIAFLESDDYFAQDNLLKKIEIIKKHPETKLIFNRVKLLWGENRKRHYQKIFEATQKKLSKMKFPGNMFYDFYINNMILTFSCVMVETKTLKNADFNTPVDSLFDWWLWIHIAYENHFYYIDEELTFWRLHPDSYVIKDKKPIWRPVQIQAYMNVYEKNNKPIKLLFFMFYSNIKLFFYRCLRFLKRSFYH